MSSSKDPIGLDIGWSQLKVALDKLETLLDSGFNRNTAAFGNKEYMAVYHVCYHMCTQRTPFNWSEDLYKRHGNTIRKYLHDRVLPKLREKRDSFLLEELVVRWENHNLMNKWMNKFFVYLNRYYVDHNNVPQLLDAGVSAFKNVIFQHIKVDATRAMITLINKERDGEAIDRSILKRCVDVYEKMGDPGLEVYHEELVRPLLAATHEYYASKAASWLQTDNVPTFLLKAEEVLVSESSRVQAFLNATTEPYILHTVETVLLQNRANLLLENESSGLRAMLREEKRDDLARLFRLYSRLPQPDGLAPVAKIFREHVAAFGEAIVREREVAAAAEKSAEKQPGTGAGAAAAAGGDGDAPSSAAAPKAKAGGAAAAKAPAEDASDPTFVNALLDLHDRMQAFAKKEFANHSSFQKALKDAFESFVNREVEAKFSNAEMIASYCDRLLKSGGGEKLSDQQTEEALDRVVSLFQYIFEKDMFADTYRSQLSKRLLGARSASSDLERSMISRLKLRCGGQYTAKMEGMMNDLATADEGATAFKEWLSTSKPGGMPDGIDFTVQVLSTAHWPSFFQAPLIVSPAVKECQSTFESYYSSKSSKKKLTWQYALGSVSLKAQYGKVVYELSVVPLQAASLLLFNDRAGSYTFDELRSALGITEDTLKRVLHSLSCGKMKLLNKSPEGSVFNATDTFKVNDAFTSQMRKLRIPMASLEDTQGHKRVEDDRSHSIEACIVRIMKARKVLTHNVLVPEVIAQLQFFKPQPKQIKKRIEHLIERDYLERDATDQNTYRYMA